MNSTFTATIAPVAETRSPKDIHRVTANSDLFGTQVTIFYFNHAKLAVSIPSVAPGQPITPDSVIKGMEDLMGLPYGTLAGDPSSEFRGDFYNNLRAAMLMNNLC